MRPRTDTPSVLVVGDVMTDVVVRPEGPIAIGSDRRASIRLMPGGSGANQAAWLAAEGLRVTFAGRVGRTDHAKEVEKLARYGVRSALAADDTLPTGMLIALIANDGERSFFTDRGANENLCRGDLPKALLDGMNLLHVSGYAFFAPSPREAAMELMAEARRRGIPVSVDPASYSFLQEVKAENFLAWTRGAALCFPNADEAAVLTGRSDPNEQLAVLCRHYAGVVLKRGAEGAVAAVEGSKERWSAPASRIDVTDSTGAGDAFLAGFLAAHLRKEGMKGCLDRAIAAASRAVTRLGARPDAPESG
jgi:sugar/nucleoside kinase (ribokinase family)